MDSLRNATNKAPRFLDHWLPLPFPVQASTGRYWVSFVLGMALWIFFQTYGMHWRVMRLREMPPETDDAYSYILKASELWHCPLQDCPALMSLREQMEGSPLGMESPDIIWMRERQYHRLFNQYHISHALVLLFLRGAGLEWEQAYSALEIAGSVFIGLCLWLWFVRTGPPLAAALALGLCALTLMPRGHGIHWVAPNTLSLAGGLLLWSMATSCRPAIYRVLPPAILGLCFLHPTGILYAGTALVAFAWSGGLKERGRMLVAALSIAAMAAHRAILLGVEHPTMTYTSLRPPMGVGEWLSQVRGNLLVASEEFANWFGNVYLAGHVPFVWLVLAIGGLAVGLNYWCTQDRARQRFVLYGVMAVGLLGVGACYVLPGYPAEGVRRLGMPLILFLTGAFASSFCMAWRWLSASLRRLPFVPPAYTSIALAVLAGAFWGGVFYRGWNMIVRPRSEQHIKWGNKQKYDPEQPKLLGALPPGGVLFLKSEPTLYFYLMQGAFANESVYYPAVFGSMQESHWLQSNENLRYCVGEQPASYYRLCKTASLTVMRDPNVSAHGELYLRFAVRGRGGRIHVGNSSIHLSAGQSPWLKVDALSTADPVRIHMEDARNASSVWLTGIRENMQTELVWPWDTSIQVVWNAEGRESRCGFRSTDLVPPPFKVVRILHDNGSSVLCEIERPVGGKSHETIQP